jgi:hypothetical protein
MSEDIVVDAMNDTLLENEPELETMPEPVVDPIWATLGPDPFKWENDDFRQAYIAGTQCTYAGKSAGDMNENELRVFVGALDNLCAQLHGALIAESATGIVDKEEQAEVERLNPDQANTIEEKE